MTTLRTMLLLVCMFVISTTVDAAEGKLIGTSGLIQFEGSGGGGIVPWATLTGYDSREQLSVSTFMTQTDLDDYQLDVQGLVLSFYDRTEISIAYQRFDLKTLGGDIEQIIMGFKYRLYGDVIYSKLPQISAGLQYKSLEDDDIAMSLGADKDSGADLYFSATKIHLGAVAGYNFLWNLTTRATKANELGLLGFGGPNNSNYEIMLETSAGLLLSRHLAIGVEYRQKPDNINLDERDWSDIFVSYIPNKHFNITLAWADLGTIAGAPDQQGLYLSINGQLW